MGSILLYRAWLRALVTSRRSCRELKQQLAEIAAFVAEADKLADLGPEMTLPPLLKGYELLRSAMARVEAARLQSAAGQDVTVNLATKAEQFERAIRLACGVQIKASLEDAANANPEGAVVPGESFSFSVLVQLPPASSITIADIQPVLPARWSYKRTSGGSFGHGGIRGGGSR